MSKKDLITTELKKQQVKELYLKGIYEPNQIAKRVGIAYQTALTYINFWKAYYSKLALNNPHIAQAQYQRVKKLEDELELIKKEYWQIYEEISEDKREVFRTRIKQLNDAKKLIEKNEYAKAIEKIDSCTKQLEKVLQPKYHTMLDTLKLIVDRVEKENKLNALFNPQQLIIQNFYSSKDFSKILNVVKEIIQNFVPDGQKMDAMARLKNLDIKPLDKRNIIDADFKQE